MWWLIASKSAPAKHNDDQSHPRIEQTLDLGLAQEQAPDLLVLQGRAMGTITGSDKALALMARAFFITSAVLAMEPASHELPLVRDDEMGAESRPQHRSPQGDEGALVASSAEMEPDRPRTDKRLRLFSRIGLSGPGWHPVALTATAL